jgi:hypothetical protein
MCHCLERSVELMKLDWDQSGDAHRSHLGECFEPRTELSERQLQSSYHWKRLLLLGLLQKFIIDCELIEKAQYGSFVSSFNRNKKLKIL